jgi:hypothetical protein
MQCEARRQNDEIRRQVRIEHPAPYSHVDERLSGRKRHKPKYPRFPVGLADRSMSVGGAETGEWRFSGDSRVSLRPAFSCPQMGLR